MRVQVLGRVDLCPQASQIRVLRTANLNCAIAKGREEKGLSCQKQSHRSFTSPLVTRRKNPTFRIKAKGPTPPPILSPGKPAAYQLRKQSHTIQVWNRLRWAVMKKKKRSRPPSHLRYYPRRNGRKGTSGQTDSEFSLCRLLISWGGGGDVPSPIQ